MKSRSRASLRRGPRSGPKAKGGATGASVSVFMLISILSLLLPRGSSASAVEKLISGIIRWEGEAELGLVTTRGNTDTETVNAKLKVSRELDRWKHAASSSFLYGNDNDRTTAQRFVLSGKSTYGLRKEDYVFARVRYEDDRFSGYAYRVTETFGYGRHLFFNSIKAAIEAGPGGRHSRLDDGRRTDELLVRAFGSLEWTLSETSGLTEELSFESGREGSVTESVTSLKSQIKGNLAMKLTVEIRHNSKVPAGIRHTDTTTSATLVYSF